MKNYNSPKEQRMPYTQLAVYPILALTITYLAAVVNKKDKDKKGKKQDPKKLSVGKDKERVK